MPSAARRWCTDSIGIVTALGPALGYEASSRIAKRALDENRSVAELVLEEGLLTEEQIASMLQLEAMTRPSRPRSKSEQRAVAKQA